MTNRDAGFSASVLYVVFHVYHDGREVYKTKSSTRRVSRGSGATFTSSRIAAGSSRLPVGRNEIVCGLWRENTIGADTLQEHTGGGGSGHPISSASVTVRGNPPVINRTSPRSSVNLEVGESQEFTARASDPDGDLAAVEWRLDGDRECRESFTPRREYSSSCSLRFSSEGSYRLEVTFTDSGRATDSETWNITVEPGNRPPEITRETPGPSVNLEVGDSQEFTARARDPDGNLDTVEWRLDNGRQCRDESISSGNEDTSDCSLRFSSEGDYRLEVTFRDDAGAADSYTWNITVERGGDPPEINRMSPRPSVSLEVGESQEFTARASDPDGDLEAVAWRLDGDSECRESFRPRREYSSSCSLRFSSDGSYRLEVTFTDSDRATDSETWNITVTQPNRPPDIYDTSPSHSQTLSLRIGQSQEFTASARDPDGNLASVEWTLDGNRECGQSIRSGRDDHTSDCELDFDSQGRYRLEVTFTDSAGEDDSETWNITIEGNDPPEIYDTSPNHSQTLRLEAGQSQEFTASARDPDGNLASVEWRLDGDRECRGESISSGDDDTSDCTLRFPSEGRYRLEVTFTDDDGEDDSETWSITVEGNDPPEIYDTSPSHSQTLSLRIGQSQEFTASARDPDGNLASVEWTLDGRERCGGESTLSGRDHTSDCELDFDSAGTYRLEVTFTDDEDEPVSATWRIGVANSPPQITSVSPDHSQTLRLSVGTSREFTASASDPDGNLARVVWLLDGREQCPASIGSGSRYTSDCLFSFPSVDVYELEVVFTDSAGASARAEWRIGVVNSPPQITSASPDHSQTLSLRIGQSQEFTASASDPDGNLASVEWTLDGRERCGGESTLSGRDHASDCELDFDSAGTYRLEVTFTDSLGAPASVTWVIGVIPHTPTATPTPAPIPTPPTPTPTPTNSSPEIYSESPAPQPISLSVGQSLEFTAKASDEDGNLASVEWTLNGRERCGGEPISSGSAHVSSCSVNFSSEGEFRLQVTFTDSRGAPASQTWEIDVVPPTPTPTDTPTPPDTPTSGITPVPEPTDTPETPPTNTPVPEPTNTPETPPTNTPVPEPTNTPETLTKIPVAESTDTPTGRTPPPEQSGGCGSVADSLPFGTSAANLALLLAPLGLLGIRKLAIRRR